MKALKYISILAVTILLVTSCNKTKTAHKKLIKSGEWTVTELSIDGTNVAELPSWEIEDCDVYNESCMGEWKNDEGGHAEFVWQFRDKAKVFELSWQNDEGHSHNHADEEAGAQCWEFSGEYDVENLKKDEMEFKSTSTQGHTGSTVVIKITKK